jgi:hypothetical protein
MPAVVSNRPRRNRVVVSPAEYRRRVLLFRFAAVTLLVPVVSGVAWYVSSRAPRPGTVRVYDSATGRRLWSRTTAGGYVVVLAVTPGAALVADADDCIHGGTGKVELLTPSKTTVVASVPGCDVYHFTPADGVYARRTGGSPGRLVVTVPSRLGGGTAVLPCPCPASAPDPNGAGGSPVTRGAYARVALGKFVIGAD